MHGLEIFILYGALVLIGSGFLVQLIFNSFVKYSALLIAASIFLFVLSMNDGEMKDIFTFVPFAVGAGVFAFGLALVGAGSANFLRQILEKAKVQK